MHRTGRLESSPDMKRDAGVPVVAEVLAALAYGERCGAQRARDTIELAPDGRSRTEQQHVAARERKNWELIEARLRALLGGEEAGKRFVLSLLDGHRQRLDRLGIEPVESD